MFLIDNKSHRMVIRHHPVIGHLWVPNQSARVLHESGAYTVRTNAQGFRSDIDFQSASGGVPRILFFGDSMTAGDACENQDRFPEQIGRALGTEVYNYGLSGSGTDQQLLIFEQLAKDVEADLIILAIYVENIERNKLAFRPIRQGTTGDLLDVAKPYFTVGANEDLSLHNVPVPAMSANGARISTGTNPFGTQHGRLDAIYRTLDRICDVPGLHSYRRFLKPRDVKDRTAVRGAFLRMAGFDPYPDYSNPQSNGYRLMRAILRRFVTAAAGRPVILLELPTPYHYLDGLPATYTGLMSQCVDGVSNAHTLDLGASFSKMTQSQRERLPLGRDSHFSPYGHQTIADIVVSEIRKKGLLSSQASTTSAPNPSRSAPKRHDHKYILGISCFYHNSAATLIRDGQIVAAAEEERFTRTKGDRRFPMNAINFCLEQGRVEPADLAAVVYYDNASLTFERLCRTIVELGPAGADMWQRAMPSWLAYKLHMPSVIRTQLHYNGVVLQDIHHRSHAASAFYPSPFDRAAILTIDGVGEWATATIGSGRDGRMSLLKELRFPNSLGLMYSAFTQFTGFKVNSGEYKMMGLAPYGTPKYVDTILNNLVDLKADGSLQLNMDYFGFLAKPSMTNERFSTLFGGPARSPESRITQREMDIARSIQEVTEQAILRMATEAKKLTGEENLCLAGGVALNCVANGRLLREGPFRHIWIQPAAGDAGGSLGAALDAYHTYFERPRKREGSRSIQGASYLGPEFSDDEIAAFLETYGYPYRKLESQERAVVAAELLAEGKVLGHFAGRTEFGPRSLGARSILGDPRNQEMQVTLNKKIKYRESFRPFAPTVLFERVQDYFALTQESPYMLLTAPVRDERRLPFERGNGDDLLEIVRRPRSDVPAITHIDYSARIQTVTRADNPLYYDVVSKFAERTGCAVLVNTSFNVRGEPIVNTPFDAYRCFMRTEMDALLLGDYLLVKADQPRWPEEAGAGLIDENATVEAPIDQDVDRQLAKAFKTVFLPRVPALQRAARPLLRSEPCSGSMWVDYPGPSEREDIFQFPEAMLLSHCDSGSCAAAVTSAWQDPALGTMMAPIIAELLDRVGKADLNQQAAGELPESVYVMY